MVDFNTWKPDESKVIWPEVFTNPDFEYPADLPEKKLHAAAMADALIGWGNCYICPPPPAFGYGMIKCSAIVGQGQILPATIFEIAAKVLP